MRLSRPDRLLLLWTALIVVVLLIPLPLEELEWRWPALLDALWDFGHPVAFAWLSHLAFVALRSHQGAPTRSTYAWVLAGVAGCGLITEIAQRLTGRSSSVFDLSSDLLGCLFALLLHAAAEAGPARSRRRGLQGLAMLVALLAALPLSLTIAAYGYRAALDSTLWAAGNPLFARLGSWREGAPPGLVIDDPRHDWRGWNSLEIVVENLQEEMLTLVVRVNDRYLRRGGLDRFQKDYPLPPRSTQTLRIAFEEIAATPAGRRLDMNAIRRVMILGASRDAQPGFVVHEVRLVR